MCAVTISEYSAMLFLKGGQVPVPEEPSLRSQVLEIGDTSRASDPFSAGTKFIRVHTDEACALAFGSNPVATPSNARLSANTTELFAVQIGDKVAVIGLGNQAQGDSTFALLQVIADPKAAQTRMAELNAATIANTKAASDAKIVAVEAARASADLAKREAQLVQRTEVLADTRATLDAQAAKLATDQEALASRVAIAETENKRMIDFEKRLSTRDSELAARERTIVNREKQAAAREDALKVSEAGYANRMARLKELAGGVQ
jgi:hypothetical protein